MSKKRLNASCALILMLLFSTAARASKFDIYFGGYDFSAKTGSSSGSKSGAGAYKIAYQLPLTDRFEASIGYTLILSNTFGGDAVFGFDLETAYFPLTPARPLKVDGERVTMKHDTLWKPFVGVGYHARQFQSVSTQYNGFSGAIGTERVLNQRFNAKAMLRYGQFAGPRKGEATEITGLLGISFGF